MTKSDIDTLFSDSGPINIPSLVDVLKPLLQIQRETKEIFLTEKGNEATTERQILIYALGKKLLRLEGFIEKETFSAKEIQKELTIKKGTIDFAFHSLRKRGLILGSGSSYSVPNSKITKISNMLKDFDGNNEKNEE